MSRFQPDYVRRRVELEQAKKRARRTHTEGCQCPFCLTPAEIGAALRAQVERQRALSGEPPF